VDLELSDDQCELQSSVRAVLERECPPSLVRTVIEEGKGSEELWARMVELDWPALTVPEAAGGIGLGFVELAVVAEEMGRVL
jgi:alkylation response protein AidB-like acyl-CoA dehydrogenase